MEQVLATRDPLLEGVVFSDGVIDEVTEFMKALTDPAARDLSGVVPARVEAGAAEWLLAHPGAEVEVDVEAGVLRLPDGRAVPFPIDPFARHCLMNGIDELGFLLGKLPEIEAWGR